VRFKIWICIWFGPQFPLSFSTLITIINIGNKGYKLKLENVCYPEIFMSFLNEKEEKKIGSKENAILEFYRQFACVGGDPIFPESLCTELQKKKFQQRCELGGIGRRNMNRRLL
jgi:hypothetical protein